MKTLSVLLLGLWSVASAAPPVVSNIRVSQRPGTKLVDIYYDVADADGDLQLIQVAASSDAGLTYALACVSLTGAVGAGVPRIVLAHGTIQGFGSVQEDEDGASTLVNWIDLSSLAADAIDYIALGDWHGTKQVGPKAWYSGTPEIDRFPKGEGNDPGNVLKVTLSREAAPVVEKIPSSRFLWQELAFRFSDDASLDLFASRLDEALGQRGDEHLLLLSLEGSLGIEASGRLERILESWESRLVRLKLDLRATIAPSNEEITALTQRSDDPLIASVASQLVSQIDGETEDAAITRLALRELHAACLA